MFEELKKKTFKKSIVWTVIMIIAGIVLMGYSAANTYYAIVGYADFVKLTPDQIKPNMIVEIDLTTNFGCYLEEYEYNTDTHVKRTTDLYYVLWTGDEDATDYRYMTIKVPASFEREMEDMADNTYNEMYSDPIYFCGRIRQLDDEEYGYFKEYFQESGWTEQEIAEGTLPYYIDCYTNKTSMDVMFSILFVGATALLVAGILRLVKGAQGGFLKKLRQDIESAGYNELVIESDYERAVSYTKKGEIKIGLLMTYYIVGSTVRAIPNNKILWVYQNTITHRRNGIKTGTTYNVIIMVDGQKNGHTISVPNESTAQSMLEKYCTMCPWVIVGYSDQLKRLYNKDRSQFMELRYNTCEHIAVEPGFEE